MIDAQWLPSAVVALAGVAWLLDRRWNRRLAAAGRAQATASATAARGPASASSGRWAAAVALLAAVFPALLAVSIFVNCIGRLYGVSSQSMVPNYEDGDVLAVARYELGWSLPLTGWQLPALRQLQRADVIVFRYPLSPDRIYVKRVIGLPGDRVVYDLDGGLAVNGVPVASRQVEDFHFDETGIDYPRYEETLGRSRYQVITYTPGHRPLRVEPEPQHTDPGRCQFAATRVSCEVPAGHLFTVGDNRDRSVDSRYWGFVPVDAVQGRVLARIGNWKAMAAVLQVRLPGDTGPAQR